MTHNPSTRQPHVLVIGGGLGGLCLGNGLRRAGIGVAVYERDATATVRRQGYRLGIKQPGVDALRACLPDNLFELCAATAIATATRLVFLDANLQLLKGFPIPQGPLSGFGVNRLTLREILLSGLDGNVHFGHTYRRFELLDDGRVRAWFADGGSATGDLLVGADGTNSEVRAQLLPDAALDELDWAIYGRTPITDDLLDATPGVLVDTFNRVTGPDGTGLSVATCRTLEPVARAAARLAPGLHLTDVPGYFSWTMPLPEPDRRSAESLHRCAVATVDGWHPAVRRIIDEADVPATFAVHLSSARPVEAWGTRGVSLLGDAIHTMSPGRGEGANTALRDARLLADTLIGAARTGASLADAAKEYEAQMLDYGFRAVADSLHRPFAPRPAPQRQ